MDLLDALKIGSMVATGAFGTLGILTDYKDKATGRVTKWGKVAIVGIVLSVGFSLFLYELDAAKAKADSAEAKKQYLETKGKLDRSLATAESLIGLQRQSLEESRNLKNGLQSTLDSQRTIYSLSQEMSRRQAITLRTQREVLLAEDHLRLWQIRASFPLSPLTIHFEKAYSMDQPNLLSFKRELEAKIVDRHRGLIGLSGSDIASNLPADSILNHDTTAFEFSSATAGVVTSFVCNADVVGSISVSESYVTADFERGRFIKRVTCRDLFPLRASVAFSSIDLIGQTLTWTVFPLGGFSSSFQMQEVDLTFPYNRNWSLNLKVPAGASAIDLTAHTLELDRVLDSASGLKH